MSDILTSLKFLFSVPRILKFWQDPKARMKKKIVEELNAEADKDNLLLSEIRLRDNLLFQRWLAKRGIRLENFYKLFMRSIRELETEDKIMCKDNSELRYVGLEFGIRQKNVKEKWPAYSSKAKKTPADYGLKKDDPNRYLALKSPEAQDFVKRIEDANRAAAALHSGSY